MPTKNYNRNARFQLRLDPRTLEDLKRKADADGLPLNQYIAMVLERDADDTTAYHLKMASKHSFMTYAMMNVLAAKFLPDGIRKDVVATIGEQATRLFGANPPLPETISARRGPDDDAFVAELFELFERHATLRWNLRRD